MVGSAPHFLRTPTPTSPLHSQKFYAAITPFHATSAGSNSFTFRIRSPVQSSGDRGRDRLRRPLRSVRRHGRRPSDLPSERRPRGARWGQGGPLPVGYWFVPLRLCRCGRPCGHPQLPLSASFGQMQKVLPEATKRRKHHPHSLAFRQGIRSAPKQSRSRSFFRPHTPDPRCAGSGSSGPIAVLSPNMMILGDSTMTRIQEGCIRHQFFFKSTQSSPRGAGAMLSRTPHRRAAR